jgi:1-aminocyclopropane-1-carboxylate deaminase/D-cysteine desulfhydrase-like pyridoxal-dependent ACC family enzyme
MSLELFKNPGDAPIEFLHTFPGGIQLFIKREDLIHPHVPGNKWRKLKYNLVKAMESRNSRILTFGGAFSNHIHATAAASAACGIESIGMIRGEIPEPLNDTLKQAASWGMKLVPVSRQDYRKKTSPDFLATLYERFGECYLIPEGGSNVLALKGSAEMTEISEKFDYWCVSCGTGGTLAGILTGLKRQDRVLGFPALKGGSFLKKDITRMLRESGAETNANWRLITDYHFGGYAKITNELVEFIRDFKSRYQILLDPVYTGKMMFGVIDLIKKGLFDQNSKILVIHTGGIQGITGIEKKYGIKIN